MMAKHTNWHRRPADIVVGGYTWLSTEHLKLAPGLLQKLAAKLLGHFGSLLLLVPCPFILSCLASGVYTMCFMPHNLTLLLATMALMPTQLTYQLSVLLLSRASMKWKIYLIITLVGVVVRSVCSILSSGMGILCLS